MLVAQTLVCTSPMAGRLIDVRCFRKPTSYHWIYAPYPNPSWCARGVLVVRVVCSCVVIGCLACVLMLCSWRARGMLACPLALRLLPQSLIAIVDCSFRGAFVVCSQRDVRSLCDQRPDLKDCRLCLFDLAIAFVVLLVAPVRKCNRLVSFSLKA